MTQDRGRPRWMGAPEAARLAESAEAFSIQVQDRE